MTTSQNDCDRCWNDPAPWEIADHEPLCYWSDPWNRDDAYAIGEAYGNASESTTEANDGTPVAPVAIGTASTGTHLFYRQCSHALSAYGLSDGTTVFLSASSDRSARTYEPDMAVYLSSSWVPRCIAFHLGWVDYGLPTVRDEDVITIARTVIDAARDGKTVEIGCMGGHGRTGTFAAICDLLTMTVPDASVAIDRVRDLHCWKAIETAEQEWFVSHIAALLRGETIPAYVRPAPVQAKTKTPKTVPAKTKQANHKRKNHKRKK